MSRTCFIAVRDQFVRTYAFRTYLHNNYIVIVKNITTNRIYVVLFKENGTKS